MLSAVLACPLATLSHAAQTVEDKSAAKPLTVEAIFAHGPLIGNPPEGLTWSQDGKHLTYLDGGELVDLDPGTGKPHVMVSRAKLASLSGAAGSETDKDHRERYKMASYIWAPDSAHLQSRSSASSTLANTWPNRADTSAAASRDPCRRPTRW